MTTSANVTYYEIYVRDGEDLKMVVSESQNCMCKDRISDFLEKWEIEYPDAFLRLRWPNEEECDEYLTFNELEGYTSDCFVEGTYWDEPNDTITLHGFMRLRRIKALKREKSMVEHLREKLREYTGPQKIEGHYNVRKEFADYRDKVIEEAKAIGQKCTAKTYIDQPDNKFNSRFILEFITEKEARIAMEAVRDYLGGTGKWQD